MNKVKLKNCCSRITDGEHGSLSNVQRSGYYFLNNNNISPEGIVVRSSDRQISKHDFEALRGRTGLSAGDLVIATCGTLGKTAVIREEPKNYDFSRSVGIIRPKKDMLLGDYLHYFFCLSTSQARIQQIATGGVQKHFYIEDMENFVISLPSLEEQRRIATCLRALDDKIALNKRMMAELEQTAQLIYDYWFTQFDFPNEEGKPYRSSGGKMVYDPTLKREIPEGWKAGNLSDLGKITSGATPSTGDSGNYAANGIPWITPNDLSAMGGFLHIGHGERDISTQGFAACSATLISKGSVIMSSRAPIGYLAVADLDYCTNQGCKSFSPNNGYGTYYLYYTLKRSMPLISSQGSGTTFKEVSKDVLGNIPALVPPHEIVSKYEAATKGLHARSAALENEARALSSLRDWLLPMLMNGQVTIK